MATTDQVHFASIERALRPPRVVPPIAPSYYQLASPVRSAIVCARRFLLSQMRDDLSWLGQQRGSASLPSQLVLMLAYFGRDDCELVAQAANAILRDQADDGGWPAAPDGPADLSISVQAYFALKLAGHKPNRPHMVAARQVIRDLGGADRADATTRKYLALFGQIGPECKLPHDRVPLSIELAYGVRELFIEHPAEWPTVGETLRQSDLSFAYFFWQVTAAHSSGGDETPTMSDAEEDLLRRFISVDEERDEARPSLGVSPNLDTAIVRGALLRSGLSDAQLKSERGHSRPSACDADTLDLAARLRIGLACGRSEDVESSLPPDIQMRGDRWPTTCNACRDEAAADSPSQEELAAAPDELLSRQHQDGGWSASLADHAGSSSDVTAKVLEALSQHGLAVEHAAVQRGVEYLRWAQRGDGSWDSATGVRFVHGTALAIRGLIAAGVAADDPAVAAGVNWLLVHQQETGGWGEAARPSDGHGEFSPAAASAIQTAWAVTALVTAGLAAKDETHLGIQFLLETQEDDGDWQDAQFTLHDPNSAAYYLNDLHTTATTLAAIAEWTVAVAKEQATVGPIGLKLVGDGAFA